MNASERVKEIECLSTLNEVQPISMPALDLTETEYAQAKSEIESIDAYLKQSVTGLDLNATIALFAIVQKRERQLKDALHTLAVTIADLNDGHDVIKRWREHCGFTSDQNGMISYSKTANNIAVIDAAH
jgi:hypothetical protein